MPSIQIYEKRKAFFDRRQAAGDGKWFYTYGEDAGAWLTRLIDAPVYKNRLLFWFAFRFKMDGYLHWGYNWWNNTENDEEVHGNSWIIYPDVPRDTVVGSIRESNQRDGVEELELFRQLHRVDPELALEIVSNVVTGGEVYSDSIPVINRERERLLRAAPALKVAGEKR